MEKFIARHAQKIASTLSGFDRLVFRGTLRALRNRGIHGFLKRAGVRLLDFGEFAEGTTKKVKSAVLQEAVEADRPIEYLDSAKISKEDRARELLNQHPMVGPGLICALTVIEPCMRFEYHRSQVVEERGLRLRPGKCLHIYKYYEHPLFGFMHMRLQTYFPFDVQICMNGRVWLARELATRGSGFERADNCFTRLDEPNLAQRLMDEQLRMPWSATLDALLKTLNPLHEEVFRPWPLTYWWVAYQTEWATDLAFEDSATLANLYPSLVRHAVDHFKSPDVLRFLGKVERQSWKHNIVSSFKERPEGVRVKHWLNGNSVKMYDKAGSVLRIETTIGNPKDFKVTRPRGEDERAERLMPSERAKLVNRNMRKSVADLKRRAALSQGSNERYLDALSVVTDTTPCKRLFDAVARPIIDNGRRFRALRLSDSADLSLLAAISRGEFTINGLRNRDLRPYLFSTPQTEEEQQRLSAKVSRLLRLLRAHGLVQKLPKSHRYRLTERGQLLTAALRATRDASLEQLLEKAA